MLNATHHDAAAPGRGSAHGRTPARLLPLGQGAAPRCSPAWPTRRMSRDDGWRFLVLGRSLERVDMTARLLSARFGETWGADGWVDDAALLLGVRGLPAHLPARRRRVVGARSSCCSTGCSRGRCSTRSARPSSASASSTACRRAPASTTRPAGPRAERAPSSSYAASATLIATCPRTSPASSTRSRRGDGDRRPLLPDQARHRVEPRVRSAAMSWRLRVAHTTGYRYEQRVRASYNEARITPPSTDRRPARDRAPDRRSRPPARSSRYRDYWGTLSTSSTCTSAPSGCRDRARRSVETRAAPGDQRHRWAGAARRRCRGRLMEFLDHRPLRAATRAPRHRARRHAGRARRRGRRRVVDWVRDRPGTSGAPPTCDDRARGLASRAAVSARTSSHLASALLGARDPRPATRRATPPRRRTPVGETVRRARATPGSRPGSGVVPRWSPTKAAASANATCSSRAAATTPTLRRSRACTTESERRCLGAGNPVLSAARRPKRRTLWWLGGCRLMRDRMRLSSLITVADAMLTRHEAIGRLAAFGVGLAAATTLLTACTPKPKPNIVLIVADDAPRPGAVHAERAEPDSGSGPHVHASSLQRLAVSAGRGRAP